MKYEISCRPSFSLLETELDAGESVVSDAGAMAWMSDNVRTQTSTRGGVLSGLKRSLLAGESFFQNTYTAEGDRGRIALAPGCAGDIVEHTLRNGELLLERGAYLASETGVTCDSKWSGLKGLFNEGVFVLRVTGTGLLFFHAYGSVHEITVDGRYTVDNGYAVAWEPTLDYQVTRARKIRSFLFADQLLLNFSGYGRLWVQSRSPNALANWVHPFRRVKSKNN
jgi:uncharacterized protein (TIGR00266 family)